MNHHSILNRVNQIHANLLDDESFESLIPSIQQFNQSISFDRFNLEFITILKLYFLSTSLKSTIHHHPSTFGSRLSNLKFKSSTEHSSSSSNNNNPHFKPIHQTLSSHQISLYVILNILPSYLNSRLRDYMLSSSWPDYSSPPNISSLFSKTIDPSILKKYWYRSIWNTYNLIDQFISSLKFINFSLFLFNGQYRSLIERLLRIQLVSNSTNYSQTLSFEYLNRQLVWESITDFILFILPFINLKRTKLRLLQIKSKLLQFLTSLRPNSSPPSSSLSESNQTQSTNPHQPQYKSLPKTSCPICTSKLLNPQNPFNNLSNQVNQSIQFNPFNFIQSTETQVKIPYVVNCCEGLYCYSCITHSILNHRSSQLNQNWECWRCGEIVKSLKRYS